MLYIIRGLPRSGKTTLAHMILAAKRRLEEQRKFTEHFEADMYFTDKDGNYNWDGALIKEAHDWCFNEFRKNIFERDVIVSNTFTTQKEVQPYFNFCLTNKIPIQVYECKGLFGENGHNVPPETHARMMQRWESLVIPRMDL